MNLAIFPNRGGSLSDLARSGQLHRFTAHYLPTYARHFERVFYFSYAEEKWDLPQRCELRPGSARLHSLLYSLWLPVRYRDALARCHVARVMQMTGVIPAALAKACSGLPFVATYGYRYAEFIRPTRRWVSYFLAIAVERLGLRMADGVIVTTPELAQYVDRWTSPERVHLIPNGVDTATFRPPARLPANDPPVAIFVGRLEPQKNLLALLEAVSAVGDLRLILVGDGSQRQALARRAQELGVTLELAGVVSYETLPIYLQQADLFVFPSHIEGHPKALLEAMSAGLPCVGTDVPGIRDLLQDGETGILCPGTDPASLAAGLRRLLADRTAAQEMGRRARALVEAEYDLSHLLQREVELLQRVAVRKA
ncbi:MAG: glycosyltransferase family 4 protein [Anaerolineae bacterium]